MKIAILQPPYPANGTIAAAEDCITWIRQRLETLAPGAQDLVLLPEYATTPGLNDGPTLRAFAAEQGAAFLNSLAETAARLGGLVALSAATPAGARWFNRTLVLDVNGDIIATYDKVHLTDAEKENLGMTAGSLPVVREHDGVRFGFATCFDLYFAEHFATLAADQMVNFGLYPGSIFSGAVRLLLHSLIPAALVAYLPAELFRGLQAGSLDVGLLGRIVAADAAVVAVAVAAFYLGLRRSESGNKIGERM